MDGNVFTEQNLVKHRWSEYFEQLLNVDDGRAAELTDLRGNEVNGNQEVEVEVSIENVRKAVKKLKKGKAPGVDGIRSIELLPLYLPMKVSQPPLHPLPMRTHTHRIVVSCQLWKSCTGRCYT